MFYIMGWDRNTDETVCLHEEDWKTYAINWAKKYCSDENMGGWDKVYVMYRDQVDVDFWGDPVVQEITVWSCYSEPMFWSDNAMEEF
jgi:hypothetical protein